MGRKIKYSIENVKEDIESIGFSLLSENYKNVRTILELLCDNGHIFKTTYARFRNNVRCPKCYGNHKLSLNYIRNEVEKEGFKLLSDYKNARTKIKIECNKGHITDILFQTFKRNKNKCMICRNNTSIDINDVLYNTYAPQIKYAEEVRRCSDDENILEVKCAYCGKWYIPKRKSVSHRISALNGNGKGESRLYCSNECKKECPIYLKKKYSAEENNTKQYSREVQPQLRQMVFERDNWICQKCGSKESLHCHHIEGIRWEPLESADIDKCITYCKSCHKEVHKKEGCRKNDMLCK